MSTGKNLIVTKVFDTDCDICKHMSKHDKPTFESYSEIRYQEINLNDVINHENNLTKVRIYQCLEKHALNSDYTIDLPVYVFLNSQGKFEGCHVGAATIPELREKVDEVLNPSE